MNQSKKEIQKYLATQPVFYEILTILKNGPVAFNELINQSQKMIARKYLLGIDPVLIDDSPTINNLAVLLENELISFSFEKNETFILAPEIKNLMKSLRDELIISYKNRESYMTKLATHPKPKTDTVYYDFPVKGKAIKKVLLTEDYFSLCKQLADEITKDFDLN